MKYFSDLKHGWANFSLGDFTCRCSYIQNIPLVILKAWKDFKDNGYCVIFIDSENYGNEIFITQHNIHAFVYHGMTKYYNLNKYFNSLGEKNNLLHDLALDILQNVDEWAKWLCITNPRLSCYDNILQQYKNNIIEYAEENNIYRNL